MSENDYIFIGGTMRSGILLTPVILGSNSHFAVYPRYVPLWGFYEKYPKVIKEKEDWIKVIDEILAHKKAGYVSIGFRDSAIKHFEVRPFDLPEFILYFIDRYAEKLNKEIPALKTPNNERYADEIFKYFPNSKFIHLIRDPRNVEASRYHRTKIWADEPLYHARVWQESIQLAELNQIKFPDRYMVIKYEDIVTNQEKAVKGICEFLNLEYEAKMMEFEGLEDWSGGNSSFGNISSGEINSETLSRYTKYLPKSRRFLLQWKLGDSINKIGYPKDELKLNLITRAFWKVFFKLDPRNIKSILR